LLALLALLALCTGPLAGTARAQTLPLFGQEGGQAAEEPTVPQLAQRAPTQLERVRKELEAAKARLQTTVPEASSVLAEEIQILERIESYLRQQVSTAEQVRTERAAARDLAAQVEAVKATGPSQQPPYTYLFLESLRDQLRDEQQREERATETVDLTREALMRARETYKARESARRQAKEAAGSETDPSAASVRLARRAELESRSAQEQKNLRELEVERDIAAREAQSLRVRLDQAVLDYVKDRTELTAEDREKIQADLSIRETRTKSNTEAAQRALEYATDRLLDARRRSEEAGGGDPALLAEVEAHRAEQQRRQDELSAIETRLAGIATMRELWERRFQVFQGDEERATVRSWCNEAEADLDLLQIDERIATGYMSDARKSIVTLDAQIEAAPSVEIVRWLRTRRTAEANRVEIFQDQLTFLEELRRLHEKLLVDANQKQAGFHLGTLLWSTWDRIEGFWNYEITSVKDNRITPGKLFWSLTILLLGGFLSKRISLFLCRHILPRFGLNEGALHAFESLLFYVLVITFALFALKVVNIPLTAFTILGGALAIGFGFGSQNIVNNFISGLIILTEQPVRVGDLIQMSELYGTVQHIGLRSTRIRTGENIEIIAPNSSFLEQNVINWTLADTKTRIHVGVGVAYGTNTRKVKDILKLAAAEHGRVLKSPEPIVLFKNFGDNSLEFEVHFWIHMKKFMDRNILESDIRFRIDSLCREADIVIAFPQRDVHLDSLSPLQVRMLPTEVAGDEEVAPAAKVLP